MELPGANGQKINEFKFLGGGKLKCESAYEDAMWKRIDPKTILFGYTNEGSYIILTADDGGEYMSGRNKGGRARAIRKIKKRTRCCGETASVNWPFFWSGF